MFKANMFLDNVFILSTLNQWKYSLLSVFWRYFLEFYAHALLIGHHIGWCLLAHTILMSNTNNYVHSLFCQSFLNLFCTCVLPQDIRSRDYFIYFMFGWHWAFLKMISNAICYCFIYALPNFMNHLHGNTPVTYAYHW